MRFGARCCIIVQNLHLVRYTTGLYFYLAVPCYALDLLLGVHIVLRCTTALLPEDTVSWYAAHLYCIVHIVRSEHCYLSRCTIVHTVFELMCFDSTPWYITLLAECNFVCILWCVMLFLVISWCTTWYVHGGILPG